VYFVIDPTNLIVRRPLQAVLDNSRNMKILQMVPVEAIKKVYIFDPNMEVLHS
jgi:hypothetical protein